MIVSKVQLSSFRGIAGSISVNLTDDREGKAHPVILHGENGSGKSSIVDALEFGLRGRLSRRGLAGAKERREVRNLLGGRAPGVLLTLADGRIVRRGGGIKSPEPDHLARIVEGFEYCPVVVRRHDVESFWTIPSEQRQEFFFDYLREPGGISQVDQIRNLEHRVQKADGALERAVTRLRREVGPDLPLPVSFSATKKFLNATLLPQLGRKTRGGERRLPKHVYNAFVEHQNALRKREEATARLRAASPEGTLPQQRLRQILERVSERVSEDFKSVTRKSWVKQVIIALDDAQGLQIDVELPNGSVAEPPQVLNEAALDLLALLILIEVHLECGVLGQRRLLVLDDVFQSVDAVHRIRSLDHVLARLRGWQVILTLHDRLWLELARSAMQRNGFHGVRVVEVRAGQEGEGPDIRLAGNSPLAELSQFLDEGASPELLSGVAGRLLEQLCDRLSINLATSVTRRRGDKYTLGDLWPGVCSTLRKTGDEALTGAVEQVEISVSLRNIAGAHYNEWAEGLTRTEARDFADAVRTLWKHTTCANCGATLTLFKPQVGAKSHIALSCKCDTAQATAPAEMSGLEKPAL